MDAVKDACFFAPQAVGVGDLSPTQGAALLASLAALGKFKETDELTRRIEALEQHQVAGRG